MVGLFLLKSGAPSGRAIYTDYITYPNQVGGSGTDAFEEPIQSQPQVRRSSCGCKVIDGVPNQNDPASPDNPTGGWHQIYGVLTQNGIQCDSLCNGVCVYQSVKGGQYTRLCTRYPGIRGPFYVAY